MIKIQNTSKEIPLFTKLMLGVVTFFGIFAFAFIPSAKADFFDDLVDFLNPVEHINNIIEGRPQDNLPPLPGFSRDDDSVTNIYIENPIQNPTVNIYANPTSISYGQSSTLSWNSNNATYCGASGGNNGWSGNKNTSGTFYTSALTNTSTFYINCTNNTGQASDSVTVHVNNDNNNNEVRVNITADDTSIDYKDDTRIRWDSDNADYCRPSGGDNNWDDEDINTSGTFNTESLTSDKTYRITCYSNSDSATDSVTIRVNDDNHNNNEDGPDVTTRNATSINAGSATLNGRIDGNGSSVRAWFEYGTNTNLGSSTSRSSYGSGSTSYDKKVSELHANTTYYFRAVAENSEDIAYGSILSFNTGGNSNYYPPVNNQPTVGISADQTSIPFNGATTVRWYTTNATSCFASGGTNGWVGVKNIGPGYFYTGLLNASRTYTITCNNNVGSSTDSVAINVRGQVVTTTINNVVRPAPTPTSLVLITSAMDRNQSILPTLDNNRPRPGDEINYTVNYQNIGTGAITNVALRIDLPSEVDYLFSTPNNPIKSGNTLIFNLGTLNANGQGGVTVKARLRDNIPAGINLNFPATLFYIDPSGQIQSVNANVSAQVWNEPLVEVNPEVLLGANVFGAGFLPTNLFGWLLLITLILLLIIIAKYLFVSGQALPFHKQTITTLDQPLGKNTTTTTIH